MFPRGYNVCTILCVVTFVSSSAVTGAVFGLLRYFAQCVVSWMARTFKFPCFAQTKMRAVFGKDVEMVEHFCKFKKGRLVLS